MASNVLTDSTNFTNFVGRYYVKQGLERLTPELRLYKLGKKYPLPKNSSPNIYFHKMTEFTTIADKLTQGTVPTQGDLSASGVNASLVQSGNWVQLSELVDMTAIEPAVEVANQTLAEQAAFTVDKRILYALTGSNTGEGFSAEPMDVSSPRDRSTAVHFSQLFAGKNSDLSCLFISADGVTNSTVAQFVSQLSGWSDTSGPSGVIAGANDTKMNLKRVTKVVTMLRTNNAPAFSDGYYAGVAHPKVLADLYLDADFISWSQFGYPSKGKEGYVGEFGGVKWMSSTAMLVTKSCITLGALSAAFSAAFTLVAGPDAFAVTELEGMGGYEVFVKRPNENDSSNPLNQYSTVGCKVTLAAAVLDKKRAYFVCTLVR